MEIRSLHSADQGDSWSSAFKAARLFCGLVFILIANVSCEEDGLRDFDNNGSRPSEDGEGTPWLSKEVEITDKAQVIKLDNFALEVPENAFKVSSQVKMRTIPIDGSVAAAYISSAEGLSSEIEVIQVSMIDSNLGTTLDSTQLNAAFNLQRTFAKGELTDDLQFYFVSKDSKGNFTRAFIKNSRLAKTEASGQATLQLFAALDTLGVKLKAPEFIGFFSPQTDRPDFIDAYDSKSIIIGNTSVADTNDGATGSDANTGGERDCQEDRTCYAYPIYAPSVHYNFDSVSDGVQQNQAATNYEAEVGGVNLVAGVSANAFYFDASSNVKIADNTEDLNFSEAIDGFSFAAWVKFDYAFCNRNIKTSFSLIDKRELPPAAAEHNGWHFYLNYNRDNAKPSDREIGVQINNNGLGMHAFPYASLYLDVCDNAWHFIVYAVDFKASTIRIYYDGDKVVDYQAGAGNLPRPGATNALLSIGANSEGQNLMRGAMDEVMLFERALTDEEASLLFGWY